MDAVWLQASSVDFLLQHGFSFDKCFNKGITSLPLDVARQHFAVQQEKDARKETNAQKRVDVRSERDKKFLVEMKATLATFLEGEEESVELRTPNGYFRLLGHQEIRDLEEQGHCLFTEKTDMGNLKVVKVSAEEKAAQEEAKKEAKKQEAEAAVGFSRVLEMIAQSRLPVCGHNMLLDLTYTIEHFVGPLPERWEDFKSKVQDATRSASS